MRVTILDYGVGNLHSLANGLAAAGAAVEITEDLPRAIEASCLVLPGVGAFTPAATRLAPERERLVARLREGLPCLAICLGMQLLFEESDEGPGCGLGLIPGRVTALDASRVPHMGWNTVESQAEPLVERAALTAAYFAHGFACRPATQPAVTAWTSHERDRFPAVVRAGRTVGVQFHPEKSSTGGIAFLRAFCETVASA